MKLNDKQEEAVKCTNGPLLILAGAGSGKTRVITERINHLIKDLGVDPYNILAITFTNKAAGEMKERVIETSGSDGALVWVSTFHSMCVRILRRYIDRIGYINSFTIYDSEDSKGLIKNILKDMKLDPKMWKDKSILGEISNSKNAFIDAKEYEMNVAGDYRKSVIGSIYLEYEKRLKLNNALDFDDLLLKTVELFKTNEDVLYGYGNRFKYIMVDEYQDTNHVQFMLVEMLSRVHGNICVVGDDDQSIYSFRGADISNILEFENIYEKTKVIKLEENYRSTSNILGVANSVIKNNKYRKDKLLWTSKGDGEKVSLVQVHSGYGEAVYIAEKISEMVRNGRDYKDFAILYRTNSQSRLLEEKLLELNIPYKIVGGISFFLRKEIKDLVSYLKIVENPNDNIAINRIINVPKRGIGLTTIDKLNTYCSKNEISILKALENPSDIEGIDRAKTKLISFKEMMDNIISYRENNDSIRELLDVVIEETGYIKELELEKTEEAKARIENIYEFINKAEIFDRSRTIEDNEEEEKSSLTKFLEDITLISDVVDDEKEGENTVTLMTLHSSKGLEYKVVFMTGMEDGLFPGFGSINSGEISDMEEERRLCYVGITRAKEKLYLMTAHTRMFHGEPMDTIPSRFIKEMPLELMDQVGDRGINNDFSSLLDFDSSNSESKSIIKRTILRGGSGSGRGFDGSSSRQQERKVLSSSNPYELDFKKGSEIKSDLSKGLDYKVGDKVSHIKFGEGLVTKIEEGKKDYNVTVAFLSGETKVMLAGFAKLKKI